MSAGFSILTVTQLNFYVKSLLEGDRNLNRIFLRGEISNFTNHYSSGHFYMSLKDDSCLVRAVMFRSSAQRLSFLPQNGMKVIVSGRVSLYDRDGQYQFYIDDMQPDGVGALHIAYEQLKKRLAEEGLFDEEHKKRLPAYPMRIGVITSQTGAALHDIINILSRRWPAAEIVLCPVLVQGDGAPREICAAIELLNSLRACDVIIVGRGGGSLEELWAFNNEDVAREIYSSSIPVVSAVGHETDFTIADFVSDLRAPTPSAAAELVSPEINSVLEYTDSLESAAKSALKNKITLLRQRTERAAGSAAMKNAAGCIIPLRGRLASLDARAVSAQKLAVSRSEKNIAALAARLDAMSPLRVLARGYCIAVSQAGGVIGSASCLSEGENIKLTFRDGSAECRVEKTETAKEQPEVHLSK